MAGRAKQDVPELQSSHIKDVLRRRAESLAQAQEEEAARETLALLLFRFGEEWYAFAIDGVRELYTAYTVTRIPRVPEFILGVINVRGEILSVTDLGTMIRVPSRTRHEAGAELPSAIIIANADAVTAVVVDEIGDIVEVPRDGIEPALSTLDKAQAEFIAGSVYIESGLIGIVNMDKVLEPIGESV